MSLGFRFELHKSTYDPKHFENQARILGCEIMDVVDYGVDQVQVHAITGSVEDAKKLLGFCYGTDSSYIPGVIQRMYEENAEMLSAGFWEGVNPSFDRRVHIVFLNGSTQVVGVFLTRNAAELFIEMMCKRVGVDPDGGFLLIDEVSDSLSEGFHQLIEKFWRS